MDKSTENEEKTTKKTTPCTPNKNDVEETTLIEKSPDSDKIDKSPKDSEPTEEPLLPDNADTENDDAIVPEDATEEPPLDIPETTLNDLAYDDEPTVRVDDVDVDNTSGFDDFLASYRKQVSEMLKTGRSPEPEGEKAPDAEDPEEDNADDYKIPFPSLNFKDIDDEEDDEEAVQLSIDPSAVPFVPLKESEKKERPAEKTYSYDPKKPGAINNLFDLFEIFVFTVAVVLFISAFFFRHSRVDGGSMDNTLSDGEHLLLCDLFYTPKRGDIIVFEDYSLDKKIPIVKRVIGIEGDTVRVDNENGVSVVYVNGERLDEDYALTDSYDMHPSGAWTVGEGEVFVLGDHRNVSWDGRSFGTVNADSILGKVVLRFYPFDRFGTVD